MTPLDIHDPVNAHLVTWIGQAAMLLLLPVLGTLLRIAFKTMEKREETNAAQHETIKAMVKAEHDAWRADNDRLSNQLIEWMQNFSARFQPLERDMAVLQDRVSRLLEDSNPRYDPEHDRRKKK